MNPIDNVVTTNEDVKAFLEKFRDFDVYFTEQSIKVTKDTLQKDRVSVALVPADVTDEQVHEILNWTGVMGQAGDVLRNYKDYNTIGVGMEKSSRGINYRIYGEKFKPNAEGPVQIGWGFKWFHPVVLSMEITNYIYQPDKSAKAVKALVDNSGLSFYPKMCDPAFNKRDNGNNFYSTNVSGNRDAFYIQVGTLLGSQVTEDVLKFTTTNLAEELTPFAEQDVHHVSGGKQNGEEFVALYFRHYR